MQRKGCHCGFPRLGVTDQCKWQSAVLWVIVFRSPSSETPDSVGRSYALFWLFTICLHLFQQHLAFAAISSGRSPLETLGGLELSCSSASGGIK